MATTTYSLRMDEGLKKSFDDFCESVGLTATVAINMFAKKTVAEQKIPFEVNAEPRRVTAKEARKAFYQLRKEAKKNGLQDMTLDEINEEIRLAREERRAREAKKAKEGADAL
ncbi:MAG: type II toxin-antitoxin system RelB/DinJ family antitoxin [Candidatus Saccharibacteria bacterium]|nr:type II toxin-antitoxin system RelB/DinJ family antitoxin [Candidatus Saccharibacteria bacterium]